jgi:hypothetical protein
MMIKKMLEFNINLATSKQYNITCEWKFKTLT